MHIGKHLLLPAAIGLAVAVPISINHDEAANDHRRTSVDNVGDYMREHVLGHMAIGALVGASVCAGFLKRPNVAAFLGAAAIGVTAGTLAGHVGWDQYLARVEGQSRPA